MKSPPANVLNWQAVLVTAVKRRALDLLGSSAVRHEVATDASRLPDSGVDGLADDVAELVDRQRAGALLWDKLALLDGSSRALGVMRYRPVCTPRSPPAGSPTASPAAHSPPPRSVIYDDKDELSDRATYGATAAQAYSHRDTTSPPPTNSAKPSSSDSATLDSTRSRKAGFCVYQLRRRRGPRRVGDSANRTLA